MNAPDPIAPVLDRLKSALGPGGWSDDPVDLEPKLTDWRGRLKGSTPLMARPKSTAEVAAVVSICAQAGVAIVPQGGNTGLVGGSTPQGEILLSLERMRAIREVDIENDSLTVEAGAALEVVQNAAAEARRLFPLSLGSQGTATIGGLISTNAGGVQVLRYGMMRDLVLGLEAVLPDGRIWSGLKGLRKDNTGYDLKQLLIGAEGSLGVVTAATLKLFARPAAKVVAFAGTASVEQAVKFLGSAKAISGEAVTAFEMIPAFGLDLVVRHIPGARDPLRERHALAVLIEMSFGREAGAVETMEAALAEGIDQGLIEDAVIAQNEAQAAAFWKLRESLPEAERHHFPSFKHDVSAPISSMAAFIREGSAAAEAVAPGAQVLAFGHVGDGNVHFNVGKPDAMSKSDFLARADAMAAAIYDVVDRFGGSISAEHGVGTLKIDEHEARIDAVERDALRAIKAALDPKGIMNPRVLFGR